MWHNIETVNNVLTLPFFPLGNSLTYYKNEAEFKANESFIQRFILTGAESIPDVDVGKRRFALNIILPSSDDTGEIRLVFENVCKMASPRAKGLCEIGGFCEIMGVL